MCFSSASIGIFVACNWKAATATGIRLCGHRKGNNMTTELTGGWTPFDYEITGAARAVLKEATDDIIGVTYTPSAFATQVVAGTNYCFLCTGQVSHPVVPPYPVLVSIFKPLSGKAHISEITRIKPQ
jgi:hypothetical protein